MFQPEGFASVPYSMLYLIAFPMTFGMVALVETSPRINAVAVVVFWSGLLLYHVLNPGSAPGRIQRIICGCLLILLPTSLHFAIQVLPRLCMSRDAAVRSTPSGLGGEPADEREPE